MLAHFTRQDVSKILKIKTGRLRYWERIGLVRPTLRSKGRPLDGFLDLVCLKTAKGLVNRGLSARKIQQSIRSLRAKLPEIDEHLYNKRFYVFGNRLLIGHRDCLIDGHSGQLFFRFDAETRPQEPAKSLPDVTGGRTALDWFEEGLRYDWDKASHARALQAYLKAIEQDPDFTDAYVNVGTIYYNQGNLAETQRYYGLALAVEPHHSRAHFNLGNVLDERDCREESVRSYRQALNSDPNFSAAHFNLAAVYEKLGQWDLAADHWKRYLQFDSGSEHALVARRRMKLLRSRLVTK